MKRFLYLLLVLSTILIAIPKVFASDIDDILRHLESPEVDYHVDNEIKTIVLPQQEFYPAIKSNIKTNYPEYTVPATPKQPAKKVKKENSSAKPVEKSEKKPVQKAEIKSSENNSESKEITKKEQAPNTSLKKESTKENLKTKEKSSKPKEADKKTKPINVYKLYHFFKDLNITKVWVDGIRDNLDFFKSFSYTILAFWQQKTDEEAEEEVDDDEDEDDDEESEEGEEEDKKIDYSKYDSIIAKGEELYKNNDWDALQKLVDENNEAAETPAMQKFLLMLEIRKKKPNVNQIRSYADNILKDNENSPEGNYGLAYFYFYNTKKRNISEASNYISKAIQGKNPLKEAVQLSNEIKKTKLVKLVIILLVSLLALSSIVFIIIKKIRAKNKLKAESDNKTQDNNQVTAEESVKSEATTQENQNQKLQPAELPNTIDTNNTEIVEEIVEEIEELPPEVNIIQSNTNDFQNTNSGTITSNDNQQEIIEEVIEEIVEDENNNEEIVEEVIEEEVVEEDDTLDEEIIEEIVEEIEEDDEEYIDDIDSISEEDLLTE